MNVVFKFSILVLFFSSLSFANEKACNKNSDCELIFLSCGIVESHNKASSENKKKEADKLWHLASCGFIDPQRSMKNYEAECIKNECTAIRKKTKQSEATWQYPLDPWQLYYTL